MHTSHVIVHVDPSFIIESSYKHLKVLIVSSFIFDLLTRLYKVWYPYSIQEAKIFVYD